MKHDFYFLEPMTKADGAGSVLQSSFPYYKANVIQFKRPEELDNYLKEDRPFPVKQVNGYRIIIWFGGSLQKLPSGFDPFTADQDLKEMAEWYLNVKVAKNIHAYKRYIIK